VSAGWRLCQATEPGNDESRIQGTQISLFVHLFVLGTQHVALSPEYGMLRSQNGALSASYFELNTSNVARRPFQVLRNS